MKLRPQTALAIRRGSASWIAAQRRGIRSHSRPSHENVVRDGQDADENTNNRQSSSSNNWDGFMLSSPRQLVQYLDSYVVGQERAKKVLSVAVFNHYNRIKAKFALDANLEDDPASLAPMASGSNWDNGLRRDTSLADAIPPHLHLRPHPERASRMPSSRRSLLDQPMLPTAPEKSNVLLIGPTGSGKTLLARTLAKVLDVPFAMSDATSLTQAGYVGEDVEMVIHRLLQAANWDVNRASVGIVVLDEADKLARRSSAGSDSSRDVSGEGVQQGLLRMLEGSVVSVNAKGVEGGSGGDDIVGPGSSGRGRGQPFGGSAPAAPKSDVYQVDTTDILFILSGAFVGLDKVVQQRLSKGSIGFDAPLSSDPFSMGSPSSKSKVALPFFQKNTETREPNPYELVEPIDIIKYGFIPEFTSRLPTVTFLNPLNVSDLMRVLTDVRGALAKQYEALFGYSGVEIRFTTPALKKICERAIERSMGARGLRGIMESLLLEAMYDVPGSSVRYVLIDSAVVDGSKPAMYYSRGEGAAFYSALAAEEELAASSSSSASSAEEPLGKRETVAADEQELEREVDAREEERSRRVNARGGSAGFP